MSGVLEGVKVTITHFADPHPPGFVGCEFADVDGRTWKFEIKFYDISDDELDDKSAYPVPGVLGCDCVRRMTDAEGREIAEIETSREAVDGEGVFRVFADRLTTDVTQCFGLRQNPVHVLLVPKKS